MCVAHISADPGPSHGRGGAWGHLWCGPWLFSIYAPIASMAIAFRLRSATPLLLYRSDTAALGPPNPPRHHLFCTAPKLPDTPHPGPTEPSKGLAAAPLYSILGGSGAVISTTY